MKHEQHRYSAATYRMCRVASYHSIISSSGCTVVTLRFKDHAMEYSKP